jgi:hypothetical protein
MVSIETAAYGEISVGSVLRWTKSYTEHELREFYTLIGAPRDVVPEHLPYILIIAPLTKLGGDLNYLSGLMEWSVTRPVRRDEAVTAELEVTRLEPRGGMTKIEFDARLRCGEEVLSRGHSKGYILAA